MIRRRKYELLILFLILLCFAGYISLSIKAEQLPEGSSLEVHFIDVGQGDAAFIRCDGQSMLVDGGNPSESSLIYSYLSEYDDAYLDYLVCTHAHRDHVGGLAGALNYADAGTIFAPVTEYPSDEFESFLKYLDKRRKEITVPQVGDSFMLGHAKVTVLGPAAKTDNTNDTSIVLRIQHGDNSFVIMGDAEYAEEQDILALDMIEKSTVLRIGHHGSDTSTTSRFLATVRPEYAVISVGRDNEYGLPDEEVLSRIKDAGAELFRTDLQGTIICISDGSALEWITEKSIGSELLFRPGIKPQTEANDDSEIQPPQTTAASLEATGVNYVVNTNTGKFHYQKCPAVQQMKEKNRMYFSGDRQTLIDQGYKPCKNCNP